MSSAAIDLWRIIPWQIARAVPKPAGPTIDWDKVKVETGDIAGLDKPPAAPDPPPKTKPRIDISTEGETQPQGELIEYTPREGTRSCTMTRPKGKASEEAKTQVCIAFNVVTAMMESYNRGYAAGRAASKKKSVRCDFIKRDVAWMNKRIKRIILQQNNGPRRMRKVSSRNPG